MRELIAFLRRILGTAFYCPRCGARLDVGLPVLAVASPSALGAKHASTCPQMQRPLP